MFFFGKTKKVECTHECTGKNGTFEKLTREPIVKDLSMIRYSIFNPSPTRMTIVH